MECQFKEFGKAQSYVWHSTAFDGSRLVKIRKGHNSGWEHENRLIIDAFCTIFHGEAEFDGISVFFKIDSDRLVGISGGNSGENWALICTNLH